MKIIVTGGAGFIGSALVRHLISDTDNEVLVIDSLTYAGNLSSLSPVSDNPKFHFSETDICNRAKIDELITTFQPDAIMHLAAESHVDRSIDGPGSFIQTNIVGTFTLLEACRHWWSTLPEDQQARFRFHHVSTDEVYGDLEYNDELFTESTPYSPSSPYSASKASSDHLVRAWHRTYGLPIVMTNCSNNYGPYHYPEKLIPLTILNALAGKPLPVYGQGLQVRDWLYVEDHAVALYRVVCDGRLGETYNVGGLNEKTNIEVVETICTILDDLIPEKPNNIQSFTELITFVKDRPGHDKRYAIDPSKIQKELSWQPKTSFESGIKKTIQWYLDNPAWWQAILDKASIGTRQGLNDKPKTQEQGQ